MSQTEIIPIDTTSTPSTAWWATVISIDAITYSEFRDYFRAYLREGTTMVDSTIDNYVSGLNKWMTLLGRQERDFAAVDLSEEAFAERLGMAVKAMEEPLGNGRESADSSNDSRKTQFNALRACFQAIEFHLSDLNEPAAEDTSPTPFVRLLRAAAEKKGLDPKVVLAQAGVPYTTAVMWLSGTIRKVADCSGTLTSRRVFSSPLLDSKRSKQRRRQVEQIEEVLALPKRALLSLCKVSRGTYDPEDKRPLTPYGLRQRELCKDPYRLRLSNFDRLTPEGREVHMPRVQHLLQEMRRYREFKTTDHPEKLSLKRHKREKWRIHRLDKDCPSSEFSVDVLSAFFGYALNRHKGPTSFNLGLYVDSVTGVRQGPAEPLRPSLAWLADYLLVIGYLDFRKERADGIYNNGALGWLRKVRNMVHSDHGYLFQLASEYGPKVGQTAVGFRLTCERVHKLAGSKINELEPEVEASRTKLPVQRILSMQHPLHAIFKLLREMEKAAQTFFVNRDSHILFYRDMTMLALLASNPLRVRHFSRMTYDDRDAESNLYRNEGKWFLRFPKESFKNFKGAARKYKYDFPVTALASRYLDKYLKSYRKHLGWGDEVKWLFPNSRIRSKNAQRPESSISNQIRLIIATHLPDLAPYGFGPHAFRHIVATEFIRNQPGGLTVAARVLHDEEETVRKAYSDVKGVDYARVYTDYSDRLEAAESEEQAGPLKSRGICRL